MRKLLSVFLLWLALGGAAVAAGSVSTQPLAATITAPNAVSVLPGSAVAAGSSDFQRLLSQRSYAAGAAAGSVEFNDLLKKNYSPSKLFDLDIAAKRLAPWASVAKGVGKALPIISTAIAVKEIWDAVRCAGLNGAPACDDGQPQAPVQLYCSNLAVGSPQQFPCGYSVTEVAQKYTALRQTGCTNGCTAVFTYSLFANGSGFNSFSQFGGNVGVGVSLSSAQQCPAYTDRLGVPHGPGEQPDADGKCDTGTYSPKTEEQVAAKVEQYGDKSKAIQVVPPIDAAGIPIDLTPGTISGPTSVQGPKETTTTPDGKTVTVDKKWPIDYQPEGYSWPDQPIVTTTEGTTSTPPPAGTTTTTTTGAPDIKTCGLPGTPPCKIDEGGTPSEVPPVEPPSQWFDRVKDFITTGVNNYQFPTINWTFSLPTGCGVIPLPAFAPFITGVDICQFQPIFHDLMTVVWVTGALFGAISLFWRDQLSQG